MNQGHLKHPDQLVYRRGGRVKPMTVVDTEAVEGGDLITATIDGAQVTTKVPPAPEGLGEHARQRWEAMWHSPVAALWTMETHGSALESFIWLIDQQDRARRDAIEAPYVMSKQGNPISSPAFRQWRDINEQVMKLEEALGLTPRAQLRLGVEFLVGRRIAKELDAPAPTGPRRPSLVSLDDV